jgi:glycosyltransferase involved in cell wall biosynthesis
MVAPPFYSVPPTGYGGTERVVYLLADHLGRRGHDVLVYCREGSSPRLRTVELFPASWEAELSGPFYETHWYTYQSRVYRHLREQQFDLLHEHTNKGMLAAQLLAGPAPVVGTVHTPVGGPQRDLLVEFARDINLVAISGAQRREVPEVPFRAVVHNAVDVETLALPRTEHGGYLLQLARIHPDKGQDRAIEIAERAGLPLVLAGLVDPRAQDYFEQQVRPHLGGRVTWIPDAAGVQRAELIAGATAMIFPIRWSEPFGLAMVEAMASGTPVVACPRGAAPELVEPGVTGWLADSVPELVDAVGRIEEIDRIRCAERARGRFSAARMAAAYEQVYQQVLTEWADRDREPLR